MDGAEASDDDETSAVFRYWEVLKHTNEQSRQVLEGHGERGKGDTQHRLDSEENVMHVTASQCCKRGSSEITSASDVIRR